MSEYREIRGSLQGERCEHKSWADLCEKCEIDRLRAENEKLRAALELFACDCIDSGNLCPSPQNCRNYIARAALSQPAEENPNG